MLLQRGRQGQEGHQQHHQRRGKPTGTDPQGLHPCLLKGVKGALELRLLLVRLRLPARRHLVRRRPTLCRRLSLWLPEGPYQDRETAAQTEQVQQHQLPVIPGADLLDLHQLPEAPEHLQKVHPLERFHHLHECDGAAHLVCQRAHPGHDDQGDDGPPLALPPGQLGVALEGENCHYYAGNDREEAPRLPLEHDEYAA